MCPKLTYLFLLKQEGRTQQLEELHVEDCTALERIVVLEEEEEGECLFPVPKKFLLLSLPELSALVTRMVVWERPSLEYHELRLCTKIMQTPLLGP